MAELAFARWAASVPAVKDGAQLRTCLPLPRVPMGIAGCGLGPRRALKELRCALLPRRARESRRPQCEACVRFATAPTWEGRRRQCAQTP